MTDSQIQVGDSEQQLINPKVKQQIEEQLNQALEKLKRIEDLQMLMQLEKKHGTTTSQLQNSAKNDQLTLEELNPPTAVTSPQRLNKLAEWLGQINQDFLDQAGQVQREAPNSAAANGNI